MENLDLVTETKDYYERKEADAFYHHVWGGEDIHIGVYDETITSIIEASANTTKSMDSLIPKISKSAKILDIGSGYGGAARYLAEKYGCQIDCLNLSEKQNERNRKLNIEAELNERITVTAGNYEELPFGLETYDLVFSQDALFHSGKKEQVFWEVSKVLKPEGRFIFTDPMHREDLPDGALDELLSSSGIPNLGSIKAYQKYARRVDLERVFIKEMPEQIITHYAKILEELDKQYDELVTKSSEAYLKGKIISLNQWIAAGKKGYLTWGIMQFQKRNK